MTAFNVVRFRVKPGFEEAFVEAHRGAGPAFKGFEGGYLIKTGERAYCFLGQWQGFNHLAGARPQMIAMLDSFRHMLEELGEGMGVTDPISGEGVLHMAPPASAKKRVAKKRPVKKAAAKKKRPAKVAAKKKAPKKEAKAKRR